MESSGSAEQGTVQRMAANRTTLIWSMVLESGEHAVVKMYRWRGPISWWREKISRFRVKREFDSLTHLEQQGIPCSRPIFWSYGTSPAYGRFEILATSMIDNSLQMDDFLNQANDPLRDAALAAAYATIAQMHRSGLHHGALYLRNVMVSPTEDNDVQVHILDTPKAICYPRSIIDTRMAEIDLLDFSLKVLRQKGMDVLARALSCYGLQPRRFQWLLNKLESYNPNKLTRNRHRAECEFHEVLANIGLLR